MDQLDTMPPKEHAEEKEDVLPPPPAENAKWSEFLKPLQWSIIMNNNKLCYGLNGTFWYLA